MSERSQTLSFDEEPEWPAEAGDASRVVFLLEAGGRIENRLLSEWVDRARVRAGIAEDAIAVDVLTIPPARKHVLRGVPPNLEAALAAGDDPLFVPLRVAWLPPLRNGERVVRLSDVLRFGDPRDPGRLRQAYLLRRHRDRCRIVLAVPARASTLRDAWSQEGLADLTATTGLPEFVVRRATLALERAERTLRGARYKVPRLLQVEVLGRPAFRAGLAKVGRELSRTEADLVKESNAILREIAATHSPFVIDVVAQLIRILYRQGYEELSYDHEQLRGVAKLAQRHPVVFLPSHKSNLDSLVLQYMMHENGLPPNHTAGGINMNFFPVGPLLRRTGKFFIRRSFKSDPLYKLVLHSYVDYLIEKRFSLEWYIEGGRSRSGKLLPPRFGLLAYVVDAYRRGKSDDVFLIPVSIAYDQIQEVSTYADEQQGATKVKEGFGWFVGVVRALRARYGRIHVRFAEPMSLARALGAPRPDAEPDPDEKNLALQKLAFEVSVRINRATPITQTSLVTLALLGTCDRAMSVREAQAELEDLVAYVEDRKLPTTFEPALLRDADGITRTLDALVENDVVSRFDEGPEDVYRIGADHQLAAAYYRNTIVHFFLDDAIAELAVLKAGEGEAERAVDAFWDEAMALRDMLKFEFFFAEKEIFRDELAEEMARQDAAWQERLLAGECAELIRDMRPYTAHRVLRPFLEGYRVVADQLSLLGPDDATDEAALSNACIALGRQYRLQRHIESSASVSKVVFANALKLADNRELLTGAGDLVEGRKAFAAEIKDAIRRVDGIAALARSRQAGLIG